MKIRGFAEEQATTIHTAFAYPLVQSVVYSTFSVRAEENENLVERVLSSQQNGKNCFEAVAVSEHTNGEVFTLFNSEMFC